MLYYEGSTRTHKGAFVRHHEDKGWSEGCFDYWRGGDCYYLSCGEADGYIGTIGGRGGF